MEPQVHAQDSDRGFNILLAEDNMVNQKVAMRVLTHLGYKADIANNGHEVIKAMSQKSYDLILMDVQMPGMDGIQATKQIRLQEQESHIPKVIIIAMTANATENDQDTCLQSGMTDYISKPIQIDRLKELLKYYESIKLHEL
ncbi:MAG: response regulator [Pseudanabaenaceae cyanobacterium bins.39]|nr:response regulator [Pseudanabaenaceae cyanobacterium bins.39]